MDWELPKILRKPKLFIGQIHIIFCANKVLLQAITPCYAMNLRYSCIKQPVTRVLNGANDKFKQWAWELVLRATKHLIFIKNSIGQAKSFIHYYHSFNNLFFEKIGKRHNLKSIKNYWSLFCIKAKKELSCS